METRRGKAGRLRATGRRIAVFAIVIACHLGLLVLMSGQRPHPGAGEDQVTNLAVITLRFIPEPIRFSPASRTMPARSVTAPPQSRNPLGRLAAAVTAERAEAVDARGIDASRASAAPVTRVHGSPDGTTNDGGFQQRLLDAGPSRGAPRLPGSDHPVISGIRFIDPMDQGIGAVARKTQRLFGIKNSHCIDVDTWRSLTPQELSARHVSPGDIERADDPYACNAPPGLPF